MRMINKFIAVLLMLGLFFAGWVSSQTSPKKIIENSPMTKNKAVDHDNRITRGIVREKLFSKSSDTQATAAPESSQAKALIASIAQSFADELTLSEKRHSKLSGVRIFAKDDLVHFELSQQGLGQILVRRGSGKIFLQAPHQFSDRHTGKITAAALDFSAKVNALFLNSVHRSNFDLSQAPRSLLTTLSYQYLHHVSGGVIIQIHGFSQAKRSSQVGRKADIILSSGSRHKTGRSRVLLEKLSNCLGGKGFSNIFIYGKDIAELGATKNAVKNIVRQTGSTNFLHIELSLAQRKELLNDKKKMASFYQCIDSLVAE